MASAEGVASTSISFILASITLVDGLSRQMQMLAVFGAV